jgi:hypothetical protein
MRGPTGLQQSGKAQTILPTCQDKRCNFGVNTICWAVDGAWFLSKKGSGREHIKHPQYLNLLTSTTSVGGTTRKLILGCARVNATPSTAMRLDHLVTREKYSDKQTEHIFEQVKGAVWGEESIHPDNIKGQ